VPEAHGRRCDFLAAQGKLLRLPALFLLKTREAHRSCLFHEGVDSAFLASPPLIQRRIHETCNTCLRSEVVLVAVLGFWPLFSDIFFCSPCCAASIPVPKSRSRSKGGYRASLSFCLVLALFLLLVSQFPVLVIIYPQEDQGNRESKHDL